MKAPMNSQYFSRQKNFFLHSHHFSQDPRFNPEYDAKTGYRTRCMVCMPVCNYDGEVIGVAQIVNKKDGEEGDGDGKGEGKDGECAGDQQFNEADLKVSDKKYYVQVVFVLRKSRKNDKVELNKISMLPAATYLPLMKLQP